MDMKSMNISMLADLGKSGLTGEDAQVAGIVPVDAALLRKRLGISDAPDCYQIPYSDLSGKPVLDSGIPFSRYRVLDQAWKGGKQRYITQPGLVSGGAHTYVPVGLEALLRSRKHRFICVTEGEKKALAAVKHGIPCVALPGVTMWHDIMHNNFAKEDAIEAGAHPADVQEDFRLSPDTPVQPELLDVLRQAVEICPTIGIIAVLFDSDGSTLTQKETFIKIKGNLVPLGGIDWKPFFNESTKETLYCANPAVTRMNKLLAAALRKQIDRKIVIASSFCAFNQKDDGDWQKQGLDDWLVNSDPKELVYNAILKDNNRALLLSDLIKDWPIFGGHVDPDWLGAKDIAPELAFSQLLDPHDVGEQDGLLYAWKGTHWELLAQDEARKAAYALFAQFYPKSAKDLVLVSAAKTAVSNPDLFTVPKIGKDTTLVPCQDCTLHISNAGEIDVKDSVREDGLRYVIRAGWADRNLPRPMFDKFIKEVLPDPDVRRLVQQYIGYTLVPHTRFQVAQWWFGKGSNGKGVLAAIVAALHQCVAPASLDNLKKFGAETLIGASLITVDETPKRIDEQPLKSAISADSPILVDRKHEKALHIYLAAKWLLRGNEAPSISDASDGFWRRLHIIPFVAQFLGTDVIPDLAERIIAEELAGVLGWAIEGLVDLLQAGHFDVPEACQIAKREMKLATDSVAGFLDDREHHVAEKATASKQVVYDAYAAWSRQSGLLPVGAPRFWQRIKDLVPGFVEDRIRDETGKQYRACNVVLAGAPVEEIEQRRAGIHAIPPLPSPKTGGAFPVPF